MQFSESNRIYPLTSNKEVIKSFSQPVSQVSLNGLKNILDDSEYSDPELEYSDDDVVYKEGNDEEDDEITSIEMMVNTARKEEAEVPISCNLFTAMQKEITPSNRENVVKWLIQLNYYFQLTNDVLFNAVSYIDILLCSKTIKKKDISVYAAVCYWVSSKVDTRAQPSVQEFNEASGFQFTNELFKKTEIELIKLLKFKLHYSTTKFFMRQYQDEFYASEDQKVIDFSRFLSELSILKFDFLDYRASTIATSIMIIAFSAFGHIASAIDIAVKELSYNTDREIIKKCIELLKKHAQKLMSENKDPKSRGMKELFDKVNMDFDVDEIFQIALCNIQMKS